VPLCNPDTQDCVQLAITRDITSRKRSEQQIREQAALLDVATDAIVVRSMDNKIIFWNKSAERLYGWLSADDIDQNIDGLLYGNNLFQIQEALKTVVATGEWQGKLNQVNIDGKEIIVESRWTLVKDEQQQPKSILSVNTDITEKVKLEAQFLRAQRMESIGTLAGGIAHDLNNVLAPVLMAVQLLQLKFPQEHQLLGTLETNIKRGAALIKQVLSFAKGLEGQRTSVQLKHLILEVTHIAKQTFPKSIEVVSDLTSELWAVSGDGTQLHQVLMNLVVNARDAMPDRGLLRLKAQNIHVDSYYARMNLEAQVGNCWRL
jgi:two-component system, cell cycle sensor histidine kinase and response regulator CckA